MKSVRVFIALPIPRGLQEKLGEISRCLANQCAGIRWTKPENIHLTLKFLGQVKLEALPEIEAVLEKIAGEYRPFTIGIGGLGAFPDLRRPSVIWMGVTAGSDKLKDMARNLESDLGRLGFKREKREFHPHFTLGRVRNPRSFSGFPTSQLKEKDSLGSSEIDVLLLMKSTLTPGGSVYEMISEHRLTGND